MAAIADLCTQIAGGFVTAVACFGPPVPCYSLDPTHLVCPPRQPVPCPPIPAVYTCKRADGSEYTWSPKIEK